MAHHDIEEANRQLKIKRAYDGFKELLEKAREDEALKSKLGDLGIDTEGMNSALFDMEHQIDKQEEKLSEYEDFFKTLDKFLPHRPSIHDVYGR